MEEIIMKITMQCPVEGCDFYKGTKQEWVDHFKTKHPDIDSITIGKEKIELKGR